MTALLLALACAPDVVPENSGVDATLLVERASGQGGVFVVQVASDAGTEVHWDDPNVVGLVIVPDGDPVREALGDRLVLTAHYRFSGEQGTYALGPVEVPWRQGDESGVATTERVFVHLGNGEVPEIADIEEPARVVRIPWVALGVGAVALGTAATATAALVLAWMRRPPPPIVAEPPDVVALRRWEAARADPSLDDMEKAIAISAIFREYIEAVLRFPAQSWTTTQTLAHLTSLPHLPDGNTVRAKRLLGATDLVKFAEQDPEGDFFAELDADLRAFVLATRPHRWEPA